MAKHGHPVDDDGPQLPREPIQKLVGPVSRFMHVEAAGGVVLLACTIAALVLANSPWADGFLGIWKTKVGIKWGDFEFVHSLKHLINDGLMAIFFFVIGLEVKREIVLGELRDLRRATLPIAAALGGMIVPAGLFLMGQYGQPGMRGWGIPMATDIAFVVGCMAILGPRVPSGLRVMLLSLAIADDIGAILVIAIGYTDNLSIAWLAAGFVGIGVVYGLARLGVRSFVAYTAAGVFIWFAFHESGVHATIAGVILGLMTPARSYVSTGLFGEILRRADQVVSGDWEAVSHRPQRVRSLLWAARETISPLEYLEFALHPYVSFAIMPIFALANAGVPLHLSDLASPVAIAVILGLVIGKPVGIVLFSWAAVASGLGKRPGGVSWMMIGGGGCLAGIGFTMAMFIASLAFVPTKFTDPEQAAAVQSLLDQAKIGVLAGSAISAALGMGLLTIAPKPKPEA